jgi:hydroxymethylpyrimidine/phosphomethylpyrimidine kinase
MTGREPVVLTVAGSDPSGGAGIQADLKTATALGVYAATVVTAVTVQDTTGVRAVHEVPLDVVRGQLEVVLEDLEVRAVKVGMLGSPALVELVAELLADVPALVVDPVMVSTSGHRLLPQDAEAAVRDLLVPRATLVTPNLPEASVLTGLAPQTDPGELGGALLALGPGAVLLKGGHGDGPASDDLLVDGRGGTWFRAPRIDTPHTHGTGCTLSAAVATRLALGDPLADAVGAAKAYLDEALASGAARQVGRGRGPVDHLVRLREVTA